MDFIVSLADQAMNLTYAEFVSYLAWGMIGNGLFVAPILTFILPAYYGYGFENFGSKLILKLKFIMTFKIT